MYFGLRFHLIGGESVETHRADNDVLAHVEQLLTNPNGVIRVPEDEGPGNWDVDQDDEAHLRSFTLIPVRSITHVQKLFG
ncbi:hypothetical protein ACQEVZ_60725 [Dactylosporangium sp. CA-152071]|uniref:hypothetical protein n=1 Tax=Dactylosporangium sp. CA-152071 TaxID=3239933 RepID=UPI003D8ACAFC